MRKTLLAATAVVAATVLPAASASAMVRPAVTPATTSNVLTISAVGGTSTGAKDLLQTGLHHGTSLSFSFSLDGLSVLIACTKSNATARGKTNPVAPGTATLSLNKITATGCTATASQAGLITGVESVTFAAIDPMTISDAAGFPVTVTGGPTVTFTVDSIIGPVTCIYSANGLTGSFSNTGSQTTFTNQPFPNLQSGSNSNCPTGGLTFSADYGPLKDLTVLVGTLHPHVFVN